MFSIQNITRRNFLTLAGYTGAGVLAAGCSRSAETATGESTAIEYLARQHGLLHRAIAILEEIRGGMDARMDLPPDVLQGTVGIIRQFVVDYHQQMEEKYVYPALDKAKKMGSLIGVLREQHEAGSQLTSVLKNLAAVFSAKDLEKRRTMGSAIHQFSRMYRAHAEREDTALFPVLRQVVPQKACAELDAAFRKTEMETLGAGGFDEIVQKLSNYENLLGIGDLASFTPRVDELT